VSAHLRLLEHFSAWLAGHDLLADAVNMDVLQAFLADRRADGYRFLISERGAVPMVSYLQSVGGVAELGSRTPRGAVEELLGDYCLYLVAERGLAPLSVDRYAGLARVFLSWLPQPLDSSVSSLCAGQVTDFMVAEACRRRVWSAKALVTAMRSLLGFLYVTGRVRDPLRSAVPSVAGWGLGTLPRAASTQTVEALLGSCDRHTAMGRRDYAILVLLSRMGLRNGEVTRLRLDDIDWQAGQFLVRGKGNRDDLLPLPDDVGRALVDYLRYARPPEIRSSAVFVILRAPYTALSLSAVCSIVGAACGRAGVARISPHRLRHTVASELLASGASLAEIGQLLRHQAESTTAVYAKLDYRALDALVRPWPGRS
jgi:integrase/recombinase XerD